MVDWLDLSPTHNIFFFFFVDLISFLNRTNRSCLTDIVNLLQNVVVVSPPPLFSIGLGCVIGWRLWHLHTCETGLQWREGGVDDLSFFFSRYSIHNSDRLHRHPEPINRLTEKKKSTSNKRNEKKKKIKLNKINKYKKKKKKKKESSSYSSPMCKTGPFRFNNMKKKKDESIISSFIPNWFFLPPFFLSCCCQLEKSSGWMNQKADAGMKSAIIVSRLQIFIILKTDINRNVNS